MSTTESTPCRRRKRQPSIPFIQEPTHAEGDMPDPTQQQEYTDIVLVVDGQRLYTCRGLLAMASPVWRRMFAGGFAEKDAKEIPLPGKTFEDMLELLKCITPGILKPPSAKNVQQILPLADEYQMQKLKVDCETCLLGLVERETRPQEGVAYLRIAESYNLIRLRDRSADLASKLELKDLEQMPEFNDLDLTHQLAVLKGRIRLIEQTNEECRLKNLELDDSLDSLDQDKCSFEAWWQKLVELEQRLTKTVMSMTHDDNVNVKLLLRKHDELGSYLKKMGQAKLSMSSAIDEIVKANQLK